MTKEPCHGDRELVVAEVMRMSDVNVPQNQEFGNDSNISGSW